MKELKYKKSSEEEVKQAMKLGYPLMREVYRANAGYGKIGNIFSIALNQYTDVLKEQVRLIDGYVISVSDADRFFITVNSGKKGPLIPANALIRFQFVEILLRMALKKYFESGEAQSEAQAVEMMVSANLRLEAEGRLSAQ